MAQIGKAQGPQHVFPLEKYVGYVTDRQPVDPQWAVSARKTPGFYVYDVEMLGAMQTVGNATADAVRMTHHLCGGVHVQECVPDPRQPHLMLVCSVIGKWWWCSLVDTQRRTLVKNYVVPFSEVDTPTKIHEEFSSLRR